MAVPQPAHPQLSGLTTRPLTAVAAHVRAIGGFLTRPAEIFRSYEAANLRADLIAGLTVTVIALPQALAYALIAELPAETGLYAAIVGVIVAALWGSSRQLNTGPTNTASLLILATLILVATPGTPEYLAAAGLLALMVGVFRLAMGLARLGVLVNFVSDSVVVGFTAGAGVLIFFNQLRYLLRISIPSSPALIDTVVGLSVNLEQVHWLSLLAGGATLLVLIVVRRFSPSLPGPLIAMSGAAAAVWALGLDGQGVRVVGQLPQQLPPFALPPVLDVALIGQLSTGALAVSAIGLVEAMSIARSLAAQTGQRLDTNQEFVGQGLANIACGLFSGYPVNGSFTRSAVNAQAGGRTALAGVFSGLMALIVVLALAPLAAYIPLAALAAVVIVSAVGLIDRREMARIWRSNFGDRLIMAVTLLATLLLPLQFAVLTGILMSLAYYLLQTSTPRVRPVLPDETFSRIDHFPERPDCPQMGLVEILGDLYFGAVHHVDESIRRHLERNPTQRFLLLRMNGVQHLDISGIHALEGIVRLYRERGGDVFISRFREPVYDIMRSTGFDDKLGADHFLTGDRDAIGHLFHKVLDPAVCIYECPIRAFKECQNLPKRLDAGDVELPPPLDDPSRYVTPKELWDAVRGENPPLVVDVREPREYRQSHVPEALSIPLLSLASGAESIPKGRPVVLVCRSGRRSSRALALLRQRGYRNVLALRGGLLAWEAANLLEAVEVG